MLSGRARHWAHMELKSCNDENYVKAIQASAYDEMKVRMYNATKKSQYYTKMYQTKTQLSSMTPILLQLYIANHIKKISVMTLVSSYIYSDYWLFLLHVFLDREEVSKSRIKLIRNLAIRFQYHHKSPVALLDANHVAEIDHLIISSLIPCVIYILIYKKVSPFFLLVSIFGALASANHYFCHAITHKDKISYKPFQYKLFRTMQNLSLLPTNEHHRKHHTAPHDCNWNFLNGLNTTYTKYISKRKYVKQLFYLTNPVTLSWLSLAQKMIKRK